MQNWNCLQQKKLRNWKEKTFSSIYSHSWQSAIQVLWEDVNGWNTKSSGQHQLTRTTGAHNATMAARLPAKWQNHKEFEHPVYFSRSAYKRSNLHFQKIHATWAADKGEHQQRRNYGWIRVLPTRKSTMQNARAYSHRLGKTHATCISHFWLEGFAWLVQSMAWSVHMNVSHFTDFSNFTQLT